MTNTAAASYSAAAAIVAGSAARSAAVRKETKYVELSNRYHLFHIPIKSRDR